MMPQRAFKDVQLIVGMPSYMEADSIGFVTEQVDAGIRKHFSSLNAVIVNADNHSEDDTKGAFLSTETQTPKHYITTPKGIRGKGNNFLNLFRFASRFKDSLEAVVVVDTDLLSITPAWIKNLAEPILNGHDYALPYYSRHQFDGTITNHLCYPLLYGLLNMDVRQPIGGEFAFSRALMEHWLKKKWTPSTRQYGIDIFMTLNAVQGGFKICEVGLGAKIHKASAPKLGPMFTQVVTTLFNFVLEHRDDWINSPLARPRPIKRFGLRELDPPQELKIDIRALKEKLREEYGARKKLLHKYLHDYDIVALENMFEQDFYDVNTLMWTQIVYQLLFAYDHGSKRVKKDIIEALKPLYFGRSVTFNYQTWRYAVQYAEQTVLQQAKAFASQKPYIQGLYLCNGGFK
ncbi:hypothetical protein ACFL0Q_03820 [Thermodesulfobacteriota bacterium]